MKLKDITVGQTVAVQMYGSRTSVRTNKYHGKYNFGADQATVVEVGVHGEIFGARSFRPYQSATANYVVIELSNGRTETVINTKVVGDWADYEAQEIEACDNRMARDAATTSAAQNVDDELAALVLKLGINEYNLPTLSSGYRSYDAATIASNKRKLVAVLKLALAASN